MTFQYLITTVKKTKPEIETLLKEMNINGNILIGNQCMTSSKEYEISTNNYKAIIFDLNNKGVSFNRNYLLSKASADYVAFLDDDIIFYPEMQEKAEEVVLQKNLNCVRFNSISANEERPIKQLEKEGFVHYRNLSSYGVWGCYYKRSFLVENEITFNESIGPGTNINHGEDTLFHKDFLKLSKVFSCPMIVFCVKQTDSTWQGENRDLGEEMFSHGYVYKLLYGKHAILMADLYLLTHMHCFPKGTKKSFLKKKMLEGISSASQNNKTGS